MFRSAGIPHKQRALFLAKHAAKGMFVRLFVVGEEVPENFPQIGQPLRLFVGDQQGHRAQFFQFPDKLL